MIVMEIDVDATYQIACTCGRWRSLSVFRLPISPEDAFGEVHAGHKITAVDKLEDEDPMNRLQLDQEAHYEVSCGCGQRIKMQGFNLPVSPVVAFGIDHAAHHITTVERLEHR